MFPAAQSILQSQNNEKEVPTADWLSNSSYQPQQELITTSRDAGHVSSSSESNDSSLDRPPRRKRSHKSDDEHYRKKKTKEKKKRKHRKHKTTHKSHSSPVELKKPNTIWITETSLDIKDAFRIDSKSDPTNLNYDTLYSNDQASYKRYYGNTCLGLGRGQQIKFTDKRNRSKKSRVSDSPVRYYEGEIEPTETTELTFDYKRDMFDVVYFRSRMGQELGEPEDEEEENEIEKIRKPILDPLPNVLSLETEKDFTITPSTYLQKKVETFNKLFHTSEGDNVDLWLEYINYQDELYQWSSLPSDRGWMGRDLRKKYRITIAEKKISIYEEAMKRFPYSTKLIIGYMEAVEDVWDSDKILAKWKDIVFYNANQSILWVKYIEACMSHFSVFQTNSIIAVFVKAISTLASIVEGKLLSHRPEVDADKKLLAVFVFYCYFLRLSGYTERAVASFQSLIEFNCFFSQDDYPLNCYYPRIGRRKGMQSFWESDVPKFGEDNAMGWCNSVPKEDGRMPSPHVLGIFDTKEFDKLLCFEEQINVEDNDKNDLELVKGRSLSDAWYCMESHRERQNCLPGGLTRSVQSKVNGDTEDPEHVVLYDDIVDVQFIIEDPNVKCVLMIEFLRFLGAPYPGNSIVQSYFPQLDNYFSSCRDMMIEPYCLFNHLRMEGMEFLSCYYFFSPLGNEYQFLIDCSEDFVAYTSIGETKSLFTNDFHSRFSRHMKHFVSTVFNQSLHGIEELKNPNISGITACAWLHFELLYIKQMKDEDIDISLHVSQLESLAVKLLSRFTCLNYSFLWDFAHELESLMERETSSNFAQLLFAPFSEIKYSFDDMFGMAISYVEYHLGLKLPFKSFCDNNPPREQQAISALLTLRHFEFNPTIVQNETFEANDILKTEEFFKIQIQKVLNQIRKKILGIHKDMFHIHFPKIACHLYFTYLTCGLQECVKQCNSYRSEISQLASDPDLPNRTNLVSLIEGIVILELRLLNYECFDRRLKISSLIDFLINIALQEFPSHSYFLMSLALAENRSFYRRRIQSYFNSFGSSTTKQNVSAVQVLSGIRGILNRAGMNEQRDKLQKLAIGNRILSMFEKAVDYRACRLCPAFWRIYMKFLNVIEMKDEAKRIFHQGIYYCPGAKVLYLDAIHFFSEDTEKILEIAEEKLIRIRIPLDVVQLLREEANEMAKEGLENKDITNEQSEQALMQNE